MRRRTADPDLQAHEPEPEPEPEAEAGAARRNGGARDERLASWLLRIGMAFVLSYAATSSFAEPQTFAGYFPSFVPAAWATELLPVFAVFETLLAVGLMTDRYTYVASMLAGVTMVAIVAVNPDAFDVLFRNVAIACAAFALAAQTRPERPMPLPSDRWGADRGAGWHGVWCWRAWPRPARDRARTPSRRWLPGSRAKSGSASGRTSGP